MSKCGRQETIEDISAELRMGLPSDREPDSYLMEIADRIEAAHAHGVIKAMDDLMRS